MDNNKLIAEFMGIESDNAKMRGHLYECPVTAEYVSNLEYDYSWDWLMPVIEEIEKIGYTFEKNYQPIDKDWQSLIVKGNDILYQQFNDDSLKSSYDVVVNFIEDYNKIK